MANKLKRVAIGLIALSMRLDAYAMHKGLTMDAAHPKDPDPKNWRTINGSKVHLTEGKIDGGAGGKFSGKEWTGKAKHEFTPKEKLKPAPKEKGAEAEKLMSYINEQVGVDLSEHRNTKREKRGEVIVKWGDLTRNQQNSIKALANKYGRFELVECGGWGMQLKPKNKEASSTNEVTVEKPQQSQKGGKYPDSVKPMKYSEAEYEDFEEKNQLPILKGTPKQISWARLIRKELEQDLFDNFYYPYDGYIYDHILDQDDAAFWIDVKTGKIDLFGKYANDLIKKIMKR